jgi:hypothetical protein
MRVTPLPPWRTMPGSRTHISKTHSRTTAIILVDDNLQNDTHSEGIVGALAGGSHHLLQQVGTILHARNLQPLMAMDDVMVDHEGHTHPPTHAPEMGH